MDVVVAGIAVIAFAAVIFVLTGALTRQRSEPMRVAADPDDDRWMTIEEVARELELGIDDVIELVESRDIPFFVLPGARRPGPAAYRFRRDEIEAWTIG